MILEITEMLYTAQWHGREQVDWAKCKYPPYRPTHKNHPCSVWIRAKKEHYDWALQLGLSLCSEYNRRYSKTHKCLEHLKRLETMGYPKPIEKETYIAPKHKRATVNCPEGCDYFDCAINDKLFDSCAVYKNGQLDCVNTYRKYYLTKEWDMHWNRGKDPSPHWYCLTCSDNYKCPMCWYTNKNLKS